MDNWRDAVRTAVVSGMAASALSAVMMSIMGKLGRNNAVAPLNGPSQWLWGERGSEEQRFTPRTTLVGLAIHTVTSMFWASIHERTFGRHSRQRTVPSQLLGGIASAATAYFVDYNLTPKRFQPGFERHLDSRGLFATYAAFGVGLVITSVVCTALDRPRES